MRVRAARILLVACVLLGAAPGRARAEGEDWLPLSAGRKWSYRTHRDRIVEQPGRGPQRLFFRGSLEQQTTGTEPANAHWRELRITQREGPSEAPLFAPQPPARVSRERWSEGPDGVRLHARQSLEGEQWIEFDPPLLLLPADPAEGARWRVGRFHDGTAAIELQAEVVARQPLRVDGVERGCLQVRYQGPIAADQGAAESLSGEYARESWWCRGVGLVRDDTRLEVVGSASEPGAPALRTSDRLQQTLVGLEWTKP